MIQRKPIETCAPEDERRESNATAEPQQHSVHTSVTIHLVRIGDFFLGQSTTRDPNSVFEMQSTAKNQRVVLAFY